MQGIGEEILGQTTTPQKSLISHSDAYKKDKQAANTVKLTPKMKGIISQVRQNSHNRIRRHRQEETQRADYYKQVQDMLKTIKLNGKCNMTNGSNNCDVDTKISMKQLHIEAVVSHNQQKREKILCLLKSLENMTNIRKKSQDSVKRIQKNIKNILLMLKFVHKLEYNRKQTQKEVSILGKSIQEKQEQQMKISNELQNMINQTSQTIQKINQTQIDIQMAEHYQLVLSQTLAQLPKRRIPNQQQMIKCIFLVGILSEQNFVLFLLKKLKTSQKVPLQQKTNRFHKIYQSLCERKITINCKNSQIVHLRILTSIYMHCRSLILTNLVTTMSTLSFFSQEFQTIYHYKQLVKYLRVLMQKFKLNPEWERMKSANQLANKELPMCKRQLVVSVQQDEILFLEDMLEIFLVKNEHIVSLGNIKMRLRIEAIHETTNKDQKSQQISIFKNLSSTNQENRLHFEFQK